MEFYLSDKNGKNHMLSLKELLSKTKNNEEKVVKEVLTEFYEDVLYNVKDDNELHTIMMYDIKQSNLFKVWADFLTVNADKLSDVLCQKQLNVKYVRAYSHYELNDYIFMNVLHEGKKVIIKGFAFTSTDKEELYVSTVCGTGGTAKIFQYMIDAMKMNEFKTNITYIKLDSVENPDTINFYSKLGFRKTDKDTKAIISAMYKSSAKTFDEFVKQSNSTVGGPMYLFVPDTRGERQLKKKKCHYLYTPKVWFDEIKKGKTKQNEFMKSLHSEKLEGAGLGDFFRSIYNKASNLVKSTLSPAKAIVSNIDSIKKVINPYLERYPNKTKQILQQYGDTPIEKLTIVREPVKEVVMHLVNLITLGKFDMLKKQYNFDKMFHLGLIASFKKDGKPVHLLLEKNERVEATVNKQFRPEAEFFDAPMKDKKGKITANQMLNSAQQCMGTEKFFDYDAFENNCQVFVMKLLECSGMLDEVSKNIILQEVAEIAKQLPESNKQLMRAFTTLGAVVSRLRGAGKKRKRMVGGFAVPGVHLEPEEWDSVLEPMNNDPTVIQRRQLLKDNGYTQNAQEVDKLMASTEKGKGMKWGVGDNKGDFGTNPKYNKWLKYTPPNNYFEEIDDPALDTFMEQNPEYLAVRNKRTNTTTTAGEARQMMEDESRKRREENPTSKFMDVFIPIATKFIPSKVTKAGELITGYDTNLSPQENFEKGLQAYGDTKMAKVAEGYNWRFQPTKVNLREGMDTIRWKKGGDRLLNQDGTIYLDKQWPKNYTSGYYPEKDITASYEEVGPIQYTKTRNKTPYREKKWIYRLKDGKEVDLKTLEPRAFLSKADSEKKMYSGEYWKSRSTITGHSEGMGKVKNQKRK